MEIVLVGLNFRTAPVEVREKVSFSTEQAQRAAEELRAQGILEETLVLSTCKPQRDLRRPSHRETRLGRRACQLSEQTFTPSNPSCSVLRFITTTITTPSGISSAFLPGWNRCC